MEFRPFIKVIFCYDNLLAAILKMVNLTMSGQYFSLETVISGIYAKFSMRMMLSPNSTLDVRMDFSLPVWSFDWYDVSSVFRCRDIAVSLVLIATTKLRLSD